MLTVGNIKTKITPKLHGATLSKVPTIFEKMHEAASTMLGRIDPYTTVQRQRIDNALYDRIYNYTCPIDMKGIDKILDIRPIGPRSRNDSMDGTFTKEFDIRKQPNSQTIETIAGVKTLRVSKCIQPPFSLATTILETPNAIGSTITTGGDVTDPAIDYLDYVTNIGSLSFGLSGVTGLGTITISLPSAIDLSTLENFGALFEWMKFSSVETLDSITLRWGSSASDYWECTVTSPQAYTAFEANAWMLMLNNWADANKQGDPDAGAVDYLQIRINTEIGTEISEAKLDSILASLGAAYEVVYYSQNIFKDADTGELKEIPTHDSDIIQLDPLGTNIFMYEFLKLCVQELKGKNMGADIAQVNYMLEGDGRVMRGTLVANRAGLYRDYQSQNPSQAIPPQQTYYDFGNYDGEGGGGFDDINGY